MVQFEKNGIPTVAIVTEGFQHDARMTTRGLGLKDPALAVISSTLTSHPAEDIRERVGESFESIVAGLTQERPAVIEEEKASPKTYRFQAASSYDAFEEMNAFFLRNRWGDGFPIIPPTELKVERMLSGTSRRPNEIVTVLEPGMGEATVEKIAINAVMAGCLPEHMPVLIAAVQGMSDPLFAMRKVACSTGPHAPILIINGPVRKELNINCGRGALGPGAQSFANTVIGRAIRLIIMNIGHAYVGELDMDTIGSPIKYSMCLGENEEQNPWEPFHVERGFAKDASTVTVYGVESQLEVMDLVAHEPERLLLTFAGTGNSAGACSTSAWLQENRSRPHMLLVCPDHAAVIANRGWSKQDVKEFLYHNAHIEWRYLKHGNQLIPERVVPPWKWLYDAPENTLLPIGAGPHWFNIIVVGGSVGKSSWLTSIGEPVTVEIRK
ncbi:MAG: hypothetical protein HYX92_16595 [Chloroflexi bacterium]|nr:hypothetical protein [Chloroflexota bacterium]